MTSPRASHGHTACTSAGADDASGVRCHWDVIVGGFTPVSTVGVDGRGERIEPHLDVPEDSAYGAPIIGTDIPTIGTQRRSETVFVGSVDELAASVAPGSTVAVGGFHFVRSPVALIEAICHSDRPLGLTYAAWGGGLALELLLGAGHVDRIITTFSSLDVFGLAPRFRSAVEGGSVELTEMTALTMIKALEASAQNLPTQVMQTPQGSVFADRLDRLGPSGSDDWVSSSGRLDIDTLLLHGPRADADGNVELVGPRGFDRSLVFAAREVLVTVDEVVPAGELGGPQSWIVPRSFVTKLAVADLGAYPTSSLPRYRADYEAIQTFVANGSVPSADGSASSRLEINELDPGEVEREVMSRASVDTEAEWTVDELLVVLLARTVDDESVCSVGSVSPLTGAAYRLAKRLWAPRAVLMTQNGGLIDVAAGPLTLTLSDFLDNASAASAAGGDETYEWFYQQGLVTHEAVSAAQIDRRAATNNLEIDLSDGRLLRLPGQGGMADVANLHANFTLYLPRQSKRNLVEEVHRVAARRTLHDDEARRGRGLQPGRTRLFTNLGVFELDTESDELILTHLHPGVTQVELQDECGFRVRTADEVKPTQPPTPEELKLLRTEIDPLGIRRLEFCSAQERTEMIRELTTIENDVVATCRKRSSR